MKSGFTTSIQRKESHGDCPVMLQCRRLSRIFTLVKLCCLFGGTRPAFFIMSCWNQTKPSMRNGIEKVIVLHDNARLRVAKSVKTCLQTLKWKVLPYPPYSPNIASFNYYLFHSMAHDLAQNQLHSQGDTELDSWTARQVEQFYRNGIWALLKRWEKIVTSEGKYFE